VNRSPIDIAGTPATIVHGSTSFVHDDDRTYPDRDARHNPSAVYDPDIMTDAHRVGTSPSQKYQFIRFGRQ
jgi:hypothetical protein